LPQLPRACASRDPRLGGTRERDPAPSAQGDQLKRPYPGLAPMVALLTTFLDHVGRVSIVDATLEDIRQSRTKVYPTTPPFSWITGPLRPEVVIDEGSAPTRDGTVVPLRWYTPPGSGSPRPLVVYFHGGGWVQGSTRMYDPLCSHLAA